MLRTAKLSVEAVKRIGCPRMVVHGAEVDGSRNGMPFRLQAVTTGRMWLNAYRTLSELADLGEAERRRLLPREPQPPRGPMARPSARPRTPSPL